MGNNDPRIDAYRRASGASSSKSEKHGAERDDVSIGPDPGGGEHGAGEKRAREKPAGEKSSLDGGSREKTGAPGDSPAGDEHSGDVQRRIRQVAVFLNEVGAEQAAAVLRRLPPGMVERIAHESLLMSPPIRSASTG